MALRLTTARINCTRSFLARSHRPVFSVGASLRISSPLQQLLVPKSNVPYKRLYSSLPPTKPSEPSPPSSGNQPALRENIYTIPNLLTLSRICACPVLAWSIVHDDFYLATSLLVYSGLTDWFDGWLARRYNMKSVFGTILDPAADKALMTTLTVTLAVKSMLPLPLAVIILGRDVLLSLSAFYVRYITLPPPKTFTRYWDMSLPSSEVKPTTISKVNTALQLILMGVTTVNPILPIDIDTSLHAFQWVVATTTIWSGLSYYVGKNGFKVLNPKGPKSS